MYANNLEVHFILIWTLIKNVHVLVHSTIKNTGEIKYLIIMTDCNLFKSFFLNPYAWRNHMKCCTTSLIEFEQEKSRN